MTFEKINEMSVQEQQWWVERLSKQIEKENKAIESATKGK